MSKIIWSCIFRSSIFHLMESLPQIWSSIFRSSIFSAPLSAITLRIINERISYYLYIGFVNFVICSDDEHPNCQSKRHRHVCICCPATDSRCHGGRHSYVTWQSLGRCPEHKVVTWQRLWSVRLSRMAHTCSALGFNDYVDLRNSQHCIRALHRCDLSNLVQCKNEKNLF